MYKLSIITAALVFLSLAARAETISIGVNGLVCSFCATGIEKTFRQQAAVDSVQVNLDEKLVTIGTKEGQTLDDAAITRMINDAGYSVTAIDRKSE